MYRLAFCDERGNYADNRHLVNIVGHGSGPSVGGSGWIQIFSMHGCSGSDRVGR